MMTLHLRLASLMISVPATKAAYVMTSHVADAHMGWPPLVGSLKL